MAYLTALLEGLLSFVSPCVLPMIPLYISYLAGEAGAISENNELKDKKKNKNLLINSLSFILGFTVLFVLLGATASSIGSFFQDHLKTINIITGIIVVIFSSLYGLKIFPFLNNIYKINYQNKHFNLFTSFIFGLVFAIGWSPCTGPFLGSALMLAANSATLYQGMLTLLFYALGIGIPFFLSALLLSSLDNVFAWIKAHFKLINIISGTLLLIMGILMIAGYSPATLFS